MEIGKLRWVDDGIHCTSCDRRISAQDENWKEHALVKRTVAAERLNRGEFGETYEVYEYPSVSGKGDPRPRTELAEIFCPGCKELLTTELYLEGEDLRWTYRSLETARAHGYDPAKERSEHPEDWISFGARN